MFGFVVCNKAELTENEKMRYQSAYCGLCRTLKEKYGNMERLSLNYDMAFLALFLSSLYEPEEKETDFRCGVHPTQKRYAVSNPYVEYAADMTILYSYYKCLDDWMDDKKLGKLRYSRCLKRHLPAIREKYPRQYQYVEQKMKEFSELERNTAEVSDDVINASGELLKELFVYKEDCWSEYLRKFGYELGRFIYLMDAAIDYEQDKKLGKYNPFLRKHAEVDMKEVEHILQVIIGNAAEQFEMLPVVRDEHLLKSILYNGVWTQYRMKISGKETQS